MSMIIKGLVMPESCTPLQMAGIVAAGVLLTVLLEGLVFCTAREFRNRAFLLTTAWVNVSTNLLLNLGIWLLGRPVELTSWEVLTGEALVWLAEYVVYGLRFGFSRKLLLYVCLANGLTYALSNLI